MKGISCLALFFCWSGVFALNISPADANRIGERIWKNECKGSFEGLTHWNKGENFPSLGIGHFIWYAEGKRESFEETFPALMRFLVKKGAKPPGWAMGACPWSSRDAFYADIQSEKMQDLRQFLFDTRGLQAVFIAERLDGAMAQILEKCEGNEKKKLSQLFDLLSRDAAGLYALIDYLNFKGSGVAAGESYKGQGWGLLQVLREMKEAPERPLAEFVRAGGVVLTRRVENAPAERNEARWLQGWLNRLDGYLHG